MDFATRIHSRSRAPSDLDGERSLRPDDDSGGDAESHPRRKLARTAADTDASNTFRKPSLPASATRSAALGHRSSIGARRRSTLRDSIRVPSGPREFPTSPGRRPGAASITTYGQPEGGGGADPARSVQHETTSGPVFSNQNPHRSSSRERGVRPRFSFGTHASSSAADETHRRRTSSNEFIPEINFDDFQNSILDTDWTSPILREFPTVSGGRALPREEDSRSVTKNHGPSSSTLGRPGGLRQPAAGEEKAGGVARQPSFTRRLSAAPALRQASALPTAVAGATAATTTAEQTHSTPGQANLSMRSRRQSHMPTTTGAAAPAHTPMTGAGARPPRKSVGPLFIAGSGTSDRTASQPVQTPTTPVEGGLRPGLARMGSVGKARRTTMQPSSPAGSELHKASTLTPSAHSRESKAKSLQPPASGGDPDTPGSHNRAPSKTNQHRTLTPSSSGNKRQSTISGRTGGLGARTISPTDARRLQRQSMMHLPPMPTSLSKGPPAPPDEMQAPFPKPEMPRLTQPSPSLIPRMTNTSTPTSARASPEGRSNSFVATNGSGSSVSGVSLSAKSSHQSLASAAANSGSRLPTPRPRLNVSSRSENHSRSETHSRTEQYVQDDEGEFVPPVPAIPKAYESPKELAPSLFSSSLKSNSSGFGYHTDLPGDDVSGFDIRGSVPSAPATSRPAPTPRASLEAPRLPAETPRKKSGEHIRSHHKRTSTVGSVTGAAATAGGVKNLGRAPPDPNGRKNNNLQPLRLPPLNIMPLKMPSASKISRDFPRPTQEIEGKDDHMATQTPEPKRNAKTPSTPMTASKATFWRRRGADEYEEQQYKALRSSSSHFAIRDLQMDGGGGHTSRFFDDSDAEFPGPGSVGMPIPNAKPRTAITPFSSGSLPKNSGEFARLRGRPSGEYPDDYDLNLGVFAQMENLSLQLQNPAKPHGPRPRTTTVGTTSSKTAATSGTPSSIDSPLTEHPPQAPEPKKEKEESTLRRRLSLGWRRASSKTASHSENKSSPHQPQSEAGFDKGEKSEKERQPARLQKKSPGMPPPKLPASATWSSGVGGNIPALPSAASGSRPSLESLGRGRRNTFLGSNLKLNGSTTTLSGGDGEPPQQQQQQPSQGGGPGAGAAGGTKNKSLHSEHPQPVAANRASSWGTFGLNTSSASHGLRPGPVGKPPAAPARPKHSAASISAVIKDKDDNAADEEMRRLSQKRKDVDSAARESEALKARAVPKSPMSPERVLHDTSRTGGASLNIYERGEIMDYEKDGVYFTGTKHAKKIIGSLHTRHDALDSKRDTDSHGNHGYDDERGDYNIILGDHLAYRYEVVDVLGKGSFGQVVRCVDHKDGNVVAVKIIRNKKRFHQQALVEVGILSRLGEWDPDGTYATLSITRSFYFRNHLCIVTPCLSINLYEFIRAHNFTGFSISLIRRFARQLLACLVLLQQKRIIHCDLKPENILLCEARKADVKVIDFGSSCREEEKVYTYIQSRFYRSPEVILGSSYGLGIDMWSFGCILAELWTGYPLFPGENEQEQLACIMEIFGPPDRHLVERCTRKKLFFDSVGKPRVIVSSKGRRRRPSSKTLQQALKTEDDAFVDFIARCLRWDPERRLKPHEAVSHPFITHMALNQRPGIPEEARRPVGGAARIRSSVAVPAASGIPASSPVKRHNAKEGNAFAQQLATNTTTPAGKSKPDRAAPETPQTVLRNGAPNASLPNQGSPSKGGPNRRHSTVASAGGAAAVAGSKRASNGALLSGAAAGGAGASAPRPQKTGIAGTGLSAAGSMAQMAARESMGAATATATAAAGAGSGPSNTRWRT